MFEIPDSAQILDKAKPAWDNLQQGLAMHKTPCADNPNDYADHTVAAYATGASMVAENTDFLAAWNTYINAINPL